MKKKIVNTVLNIVAVAFIPIIIYDRVKYKLSQSRGMMRRSKF